MFVYRIITGAREVGFVPNSLTFTLVPLNITFSGVYIRELKESREIQEYTVTVEPKFKEFSGTLFKFSFHFLRVQDTFLALDNLYQADFSMNIVLQSDVDYVQHPSLFMLTSEGRNFTLKVDPTGLRKGGVYYTEVGEVFVLHLLLLSTLLDCLLLTPIMCHIHTFR